MTHEDHIYILDYKKQSQSALCDQRVKALLNNYIPDNYIIERNKYNKPFVSQNINFSISHSNNLLALAFSKNIIGVDIEYIQARVYAQKISQRYFSLQEPRNNIYDFYRSWSAREAYVKALGKSLGSMLGHIHVKIISKNSWLISSNNTYNYIIKFKIYNKIYLITCCQELNNNKKICYL